MNRYTDFDLSMRLNPLTGDFIILKDAPAIRESIAHILKSTAFDFYNQPTVSSIDEYVFENLNQITIAELKESVKFNIKKYEKRVTLNSVDVTSGTQGSQTVIIYIKYTIIDTNIVDDYSYVVKRKV